MSTAKSGHGESGAHLDTATVGWNEPLPMNLPSSKEPPLPVPLLHKCVEEREVELGDSSSWAQLTSFFAGWVLSLTLSLTLSPLREARESDTCMGAVSRCAQKWNAVMLRLRAGLSGGILSHWNSWNLWERTMRQSLGVKGRAGSFLPAAARTECAPYHQRLTHYGKAGLSLSFRQ
jgi:hypothetical protein